VIAVKLTSWLIFPLTLVSSQVGWAGPPIDEREELGKLIVAGWRRYLDSRNEDFFYPFTVVIDNNERTGPSVILCQARALASFSR
jgi:hypothetical protein